MTRFHSTGAADSAERDFIARFSAGAVPDEMPEFTLDADGPQGLAITTLLKQAGLSPSASEAVRNIEQGGVRIDGMKISDRSVRLEVGRYVVQVGKRKWARVTVR